MMDLKRHPWLGSWSLAVIAVLLAGGLARTAGALEDHEWMYPGYDTGWTGGAAMVDFNTFRMHASDEDEFILYSWFAAAFGMCDDPIETEDAWQGWYFNKDYPYPTFTVPATGNDYAGLYCHEGTLEFVFDVDGALYDDVTYNPLTWGERYDGSPWGYMYSGSWNEVEQLFWYDSLTGIPVFHVTDTSMEGTAGVANKGHLYFWPYTGLTGTSWEDAMYTLEQAYYCTQPNGDTCLKDVFAYEGNSEYTVEAYYIVYEGIDSNVAWDGETHPTLGTPLNDFNILWTPGVGSVAANYLVLSNEVDNECACDLDARWHHTDPSVFPPSECDIDLTWFDEASDYSSGLAFLAAMDLCNENITNMSLQHWGFPSGMDYVGGTTNGGSIGVRTDYGSAYTPRWGDRLLVMSTGDIGGVAATDSGYMAEWWSYSGTTGFVDYALPTYKRVCSSAECCNQTDYRYDITTIEFDVEVPSGAHGVSYDVVYFSQEYPEWVGSVYNDGIEIVIEDPKVADWMADPDFPGYGCDSDGDGIYEANVAFDDTGTPLRVNNHFVDQYDCATFANVLDHNGNEYEATVHDTSWTYSATVPCCSYGSVTEERYCDVPSSWASSHPNDCPSYGTYLGNWGYCSGAGETSGGTTWLTNSFGVTEGSTMHVRFSIYDKSDGIFDTTMLLDNWTWMTDDPGSPTLYQPPSTAFAGSLN